MYQNKTDSEYNQQVVKICVIVRVGFFFSTTSIVILKNIFFTNIEKYLYIMIHNYPKI